MIDLCKNCSTCKFWNISEITEIYGVDVCSQYQTASFNPKDKTLVKIKTKPDFYCSLWEGGDE